MDLARLECDLLYRLLPLDIPEAAIATVERALWGVDDAPVNTCAGRMVRSLRQAAAPLLETPNAHIYWITGRILHALRMLGGTWPDVVPFNIRQRTTAIVASIRELAEMLRAVLGGEVGRFRVPATIEPPPDGGARAEFSSSVRWLILQRENASAFRLTRRVTAAYQAASPVEARLLGAFGGIVSRQAPAATRDLMNREGLRLSPYGHGLAALCEGLWTQRHGGNSKAVAKHLLRATQRFTHANDRHFAAISDDQLARAYRRLGRVEPAKARFQESIATKRAIQDRHGLGASLGGLAELMMATGDYAAAIQYYVEDLGIALEVQDVRAEAQLRCKLGEARTETLEATESLDELHRSLACARGLLPTGTSESIDTAFALVALGVYHVYWNALGEARSYEAQARRAFEVDVQDEQTRRAGVALCELLDGEIFAAEGAQVSSRARLESGFGMLLAIDRVAALDQAIRVSYFLVRCSISPGWLVQMIREALGEDLPAAAHAILIELRAQ